MRFLRQRNVTSLCDFTKSQKSHTTVGGELYLFLTLSFNKYSISISNFIGIVAQTRAVVGIVAPQQDNNRRCPPYNERKSRVSVLVVKFFIQHKEMFLLGNV